MSPRPQSRVKKRILALGQKGRALGRGISLTGHFAGASGRAGGRLGSGFVARCGRRLGLVAGSRCGLGLITGCSSRFGLGAALLTGLQSHRKRHHCQSQDEFLHTFSIVCLNGFGRIVRISDEFCQSFVQAGARVTRPSEAFSHQGSCNSPLRGLNPLYRQLLPPDGLPGGSELSPLAKLFNIPAGEQG